MLRCFSLFVEADAQSISLLQSFRPMTVDVAEARELAKKAAAAAPSVAFMVNNTANFRDQGGYES